MSMRMEVLTEAASPALYQPIQPQQALACLLGLFAHGRSSTPGLLLSALLSRRVRWLEVWVALCEPCFAAANSAIASTRHDVHATLTHGISNVTRDLELSVCVQPP